MSQFSMRNYKDNIIVQMTFQFALEVLSFCEALREQRRFAFSDQLLRSGCSIGANVKEAQNAESTADFIHKMKIAAKEAEETEYWLELCALQKEYPNPGKLLDDVVNIMRVLVKIISTTKAKEKKQKLTN